MTTEMMDCYVPEGEQVDSGPINKENYKGTLDALTAAAFAELEKLLESTKKQVDSTLN